MPVATVFMAVIALVSMVMVMLSMMVAVVGAARLPAIRLAHVDALFHRQNKEKSDKCKEGREGVLRVDVEGT